MKKAILLLVLPAFLFASAIAAADVHIRAVFDEADAALVIMERLQRQQAISEPHWQALWNSEGYTRLLAREAAMGRDEGFGDKLAAWLQDPANYERAAEWRSAIKGYRSFDANAAGDRAAAYLPDNIALTASFYPVIKHTSNSFVFDLENDPAIFMTVDPENTARFVESVLAHELHHVGYAQCADTDDADMLSPNQQWVVSRLQLFGEGFAALAAAGDPMTHPHFYSTPDEWAIWERDVANVATDQARMEAFFQRVLDDSVPESERRPLLFSFIATEHVPQGPAYTLGWKMAALVERRYGHDAVVDSMCDVRKMLSLYNEAAAEVHVDKTTTLPMWSQSFIEQLFPRRAPE